MHHTIALFNLTLVAVWTLLLLPLQLVVLALRLPLAALVPRVYHRGKCLILGIKIELVGQKAPTGAVLFPEGTSSDGNRVLPFKSSFFAVAEAPVRGRPLAVQPVSLACTRLDNIQMGRRLRPMFAWYGDMSLLPHLWRIFGAGSVTAVVEFHPVVTIDLFISRKTLAAHCHAEVAAGLSRALAGRLRPSGIPAEEPGTGPGKLDTWGANASVSE
ncbi:MAG: hypothetical protein V3S87_05170 [Alphaproteobacteria bacterium]